jgi:hypothetical protein
MRRARHMPKPAGAKLILEQLEHTGRPPSLSGAILLTICHPIVATAAASFIGQ